VAGRDERQKRESGIQRFFRETSGELKRVSWPTRQEALRLTGIVIVVLFVMSIFLGLVDLAAQQLLALALGA
jgi:preprotein translocase subunit SecE